MKDVTEIIFDGQNKKSKQKVKGYISNMGDPTLLASYKGEVRDKEVRFPKELGTEHPFSFEDVEKVYRKVGLMSGAINKIVDNIVGEFSIKVDNENAKALLDEFIKDSNFATEIRAWIREGCMKGNGFMEIDLNNSRIRVLNANNMYVKRDTKGNVTGYNQYLGALNTFNNASRKLIPFNSDQIAHFPVNQIAGEAYGLGLIWPNERVIENLIENEQDLHKLIKRKAGAPLHVKIGQPGEMTDPATIDTMADRLKFLNNRTEWPTDGNIEMKVIDFGQLGNSLTETLMYDFRMLVAGMEIPEVLFGSGQLNEGIAKVQLETFQRRIAAIQDQIESIIEEKIFRPLLRANMLDEQVEFVWNLPGESEINARIDQIQKLLNTFGISENMKRMLQLELAKLLNIEGAEEFLSEPEVGLDDQEKQMDLDMKKASLDGVKQEVKDNTGKNSPEAKKEAKLRQPEVPGAKPGARQSTEIEVKETEDLERINSGDIGIREFANLREMPGFNYSDYLIKILQRLKVDDFKDLTAITEQDLADGLLNDLQIKKLRLILKDGFKRNQTIRQIETNIKDNLNLSDRLNEGKLVLTADNRPNAIARTEIVRISNEGLLDAFRENNIDKVRYLSVLSNRTCDICENSNGQVYNLNESYGVIPKHVNCRCTWVSI